MSKTVELIDSSHISSMAHYSYLIDGLLRLGKHQDAFQYFKKMISNHKHVGVITYESLLRQFLKHDLLHYSRRVLDHIFTQSDSAFIIQYIYKSLKSESQDMTNVDVSFFLFSFLVTCKLASYLYIYIYLYMYIEIFTASFIIIIIIIIIIGIGIGYGRISIVFSF